MKNALHEKIISLLNLQKKHSYSILDIGCGNGALLHALSQHVAPTSHLVGIDASKAAIKTAQATNPGLDLQQYTFVTTLPFPDEHFDIVLSVDTLECIPHKELLLHEISRVLKPHGVVLCAHWDWDTQVYASNHPQRIRQLVHAFADWQQGWMEACDGMMGRKLWGLFQRTQCFQGKVVVFTLIETAYQIGNYGYDRLHDLQILVNRQELRDEDYVCIQQEMQTLHQQGTYFYSVNSYIYYGKKGEG